MPYSHLQLIYFAPMGSMITNKQLLAALYYIDIVKRDIEDTHSVSYSHKDSQLLGNHICSLIQAAPGLKDRLNAFLDNETTLIEEHLKEL